MSQKRAVLVTGASSGIGQAIVSSIDQRAFTVYGASRSILTLEPISGVKMLPLDVREDESVSACVDAVLKESGRLDVLINNAGYALRGAAEEVALEEAKAQFETNFWGVVRMVRAALPVMRSQGEGQIVNISSLAGVMAMPFVGVYSASKFALEGYTEALRHEVKPFGIRVSLVEPNFIKTNFYRDWRQAANLMDEYAPWRERMQGAAAQSLAEADGPDVVAACVVGILNADSPQLRYQVGKNADFLYQLQRTQPELLFEQMLRSSLRLDVEGQDGPQAAGAGLQS